MGKIVATCGHEITWEWMDDPRSKCIEKSLSRECKPAISYTVRCESCRDWFAQHGVLLDSEEAADEWLASQRAPTP